MVINLNDINFLKAVEDFTSSLLQQKDDVNKLIEVVVAEKKEEEFEKLTFTAKYICGMLRVIKNAPGIPEVSSTEHIKLDLNENIKKGIEQLKEIIAFSGEGERDYFDKTYFALTAQTFSNLTQLFSDLESVKKYFNHIKRQS